MKFLSVCSGIEAASVAWEPLGFEAVAFSEIEKFPSAVLNHHYPNVPNYGDITKHAQWPRQPIDVLVGGTPCQSFSVAGLRKGLEDPRGNLTLVFLAVLEQFRPKWVVWENVPGVLSDKTGAFGAFLGGLGQLGYGFAYRVLDAQYFGVPQRRRRVFVVGCLGDWRSAAAVLFEPESLRGDSPPRREKGERIAGTITGGTGMCGASDNGDVNKNGALIPQISLCLNAGAMGRQDFETETLIPVSSDVVAHTIGTQCGQATEDGTGRVAPLVCFEPGSISRNAGPSGESFLAPTLRSEMGDNQPAVRIGMSIRRLTPIECERLQGFPDNYTQIPWRGKPSSQCPYGPRYKALGNSMAVPVMKWIGNKIKLVNQP